MSNGIYLTTQFVVSMTSPLDSLTVFLNKLLGNNQTPDGYLMYLLVMSGIFIIGLVLIYNWWEEKKFNVQVEKSFSPIQNDALLDRNKKQFLDKFAATTGYLSDTPDANSFGGQKSTEFADEKSIDDVYSELLSTMSKRAVQKDKSEHNVDEAFNLPNMIIEPKDAPLEKSVAQPHSTGEQAFENQDPAEGLAENIAPEQHLAIRSIIDQVFRSKSYAPKNESASIENANAINTSASNKTLIKDTSALDAFVSIKNSLALDEPNSEVERALNSAEKNQQLNHATQHAPTVDEEKQKPTGLSAVNVQAEVKDGSSVFEKTPAETSEDTNAVSIPSDINTQIDLIGILQLSAGVTLDLLADSFSPLHKEFDKPIFVYIQDKDRNWCILDNHNKQHLMNLVDYRQPQNIICSMQLADRSGAASRNVVNRFQMAYEAIAVNFGGRVQWQNEGDVFAQAMTLDAFCIEVDKTMFFHLMHETTGPFTGIKLKGIAESQGMALGNNGSFKYFGETNSKYPEFVMFNRDNHPFSPEMLRSSVVKAVTFQLDIPHTLPQAVALDHMVAVAKYMEVGLNAVLVDDNNRPLADIQIERIRDQIKSIHAMMQLRGIIPGSDIAHRLFS